jgi:hypothetical protein
VLLRFGVVHALAQLQLPAHQRTPLHTILPFVHTNAHHSRFGAHHLQRIGILVHTNLAQQMRCNFGFRSKVPGSRPAYSAPFSSGYCLLSTLLPSL